MENAMRVSSLVLFAIATLCCNLAVYAQGGGAPFDYFNRPVRLSAPIKFTSGASNPSRFTLADMNGDGRLDFVIANPMPLIVYGRGDGTATGKLLLPWPIAPSSAVLPYAIGDPTAILATDLNGDAMIDVATIDSPRGRVHVHYLGPSGTVVATSTHIVGTSSALASWDVTSDGRRDLIVGRGSVLSVLPNIGASFGTPVEYFVGGSTDDLAVADFNADGYMDILTCVRTHGSVAIAFGVRGGLASGILKSLHSDLWISTTTVAVGSFLDRSAPHDLLVTVKDKFGSHSQYVLRLHTDGQLYSRPTGSAGPGPARVAVGDLNGDGLDEAVVADSVAQSVRVLQRDAHYEQMLPVAILSVKPSRPSDVAIGDLNNDGRLDIAVLDFFGAMIVYLNETPEPPLARRRAVRH
jgi:hypothetical protein